MIDIEHTETTKTSAWRELCMKRASRIREDLEAGKISVRTDCSELEARYGDDGWRNFKQALRDHSRNHGCLVLTDDANGGSYVAMMEHFRGEVTAEEAGDHFAGPLFKHIAKMEAARKASQPDNVVSLHKRKATRFSIYCLPFGDYSKDDEAFFEERGEYVWQINA